jgi:predicted small lipoprotein YifL
MQKSRRRILVRLAAIAAAGAVAGCGQKGPLYLPQDRLDEAKKSSDDVKKKAKTSRAPLRANRADV